MKRQELFATLSDCIRSKVSQIKVEDITENAHIMLDLGADSLESVEIVACMMKRTGIKIPTAEISQMLMTVGETIDLFEKYGPGPEVA